MTKKVKKGEIAQEFGADRVHVLIWLSTLDEREVIVVMYGHVQVRK